MRTYTADQMTSIGGNAWTSRDGRRHRVYLDNVWPAGIGLGISQYKSGNISGASLRGAPLSNTRAGQLLRTRVYWEDGRVVIDGLPPRVDVTEAEIRAAIDTAVSAT